MHATTKEHVCHVCGKEFSREGFLKKHLRIHDDSSRPGCDLCGAKFACTNSVQAHKVKEHGADPCICDECGETFTTLRGLNFHKWRHMGLRPHKCEFSVEFENGANRTIHHNTIHYPSGGMTCDATFIRKGELKSHLKSHSLQRPFPCPHCDKAFKHSHKLRDHLNRLHTPGYVRKLRKCPHCEKSFRGRATLKRHLIRAHGQGGPFPFPCDQCGKGFVFSAELALHLKRVHTVDASARRRKRVQRARRAATPKIRKKVTKALQSIRDKFLAAGGELSFICEHCGKGYMAKASLQRHLKKVHGVLGARQIATKFKRGRSSVQRRKGRRTKKKEGKKNSKRGTVPEGDP
ncbi:Zinc finger protein 99 [Folsomia candida]|uniref:Zinc finger protein 99 n=1 Tax=Folsomia candida TaxID=158441 RepID=A0A226D6W8_FOLCA|nr:Zinc finger protein 99 [Folsomia candida]